MEICLKYCFAIKHIRRLLTACCAVFLFPSAALPDENSFQPITFGAPEGIHEFLQEFNALDQASCGQTCADAPPTSKVLVVFVESFDDRRFIPQVLAPVFDEIVAQRRHHAYSIRSEVFGNALDADVQFIVASALREKIASERMSLSRDGGSFECNSAGIVIRNRSVSGPVSNFDWSDIFEVCEAFSDG